MVTGLNLLNIIPYMYIVYVENYKQGLQKFSLICFKCWISYLQKLYTICIISLWIYNFWLW